MKINKDLVEALMMLGGICLVLTGTTDFDNATAKNILMAAVAFVSLLLVGLRIKAARQPDKNEQEY